MPEVERFVQSHFLSANRIYDQLLYDAVIYIKI